MSYQQFGHVDREDRIDLSDETPPPDDEYPPRRRLPGIILAVGVMAVFAGGLWFAYHAGSKRAAVTAAVETGNVPLIHADGDPVKVKPDKAGGMDIPDKDNPVYSLRPGSNAAEHILPPPEAPAPRPIAPPPPPPPPPQIAAAPSPAVLPAPGPPPVAAAPKPAPRPADAAKPADPAKPVAAGPPTRIQLASLRTPDEARDEWARLKREHGDLLGKLTAVAVKADLGERGIYYRVEAGPLGDREAAVRLCKALKDRGLGCSLVQ
jgi:hypothetical protein